MGGLRVFEGAANYLLVQGAEPGFDVTDLQNFLGRRGILIRRADNFHGLDRRYFRVAVLKPPHNRRLVEEIEKYLGLLRSGRTDFSKHNQSNDGGLWGGEG